MSKILKFFSSLIGKLVLAAIVCGAVYSLLGFFLVPYIAKQQAEKIVQEKFGVKPEIQNISFNPFTFEASIFGFDLPAKKNSGESKSRLKFEKFYANLSIFPLLKKEIHFAAVSLKSAQGQFIIYKDGSINWEMKEEKAPPESKEALEWSLFLEHVQIDNSGLDFLDYTHVSPMEIPIGPMSLQASNLSTSFGKTTAINSLVLAVGESGHLKISGSLHLKPFSADLNLDVAELPLDFLTAYLSDKTVLSLKDGNLDLLGSLKYDQGNVFFEGSSAIRNLSLVQEDVEKPVLTWDKMELKGLKVQSAPLKVRIAEVKLEKPNTEIILFKEGTLNFKDLLRSSPKNIKPAGHSALKTSTGQNSTVPAKVEETADKKTDGIDFLADKLVISSGSLDYSDLQIKPHFMAHVHGLQGSISPLSSDRTQKINVNLEGLVEAYGKFKAQGYVIPGLKKPTLNLGMNFYNIEMTTFTPYSGHFAGYEISKGKLFLDLHYTLVNNRIKGDNQVMLDQFTLGKKVESENATGWPLRLAVTLMKDRKGQIKFKLPVEGDLSSPAFSWGSLIWTALKNMVVNIIAAPFDFLASLVGGGANLQAVEFEPGTSTLKAGESAKIEKLGKALDERPSIALEITGQFQDQDIEALQMNSLNKKLEPLLKSNKGDRSAAVRKLAKSLLKGNDLDVFTSSYESEHGKNAPGFTDDLAKKLASLEIISDDQIKSLGLARGNVVMSSLVANKVSAERLYLLATVKAEKNKPPQALLTIKEK